jgi:hypothetical protein
MLTLIKNVPIPVQIKRVQCLKDLPGSARHFAGRIDVLDSDEPLTVRTTGMQVTGDGSG